MVSPLESSFVMAHSSFYINSGTHSIVLLACCDVIYLFTMIDIGSAGRNSDGGVYSHLQFGQALELNEIGLPAPDLLPNTTGTRCPYLFTADDAFPLKTWMMKPYKGSFLSESNRIFNYRLSRARRIIEKPLKLHQQGGEYGGALFWLHLKKLQL